MLNSEDKEISKDALEYYENILLGKQKATIEFDISKSGELPKPETHGKLHWVTRKQE